MPLSDEQVIACLSHEGDRTAMLNAAYRMGMLRAAEVAREARDSAFPVAGHVAIADAIRADAGSTDTPSPPPPTAPDTPA